MERSIQSIQVTRKANGLFLALVLVTLFVSVMFWILTGADQIVILSGMGVAMVFLAISIGMDWRSGIYAFFAWLLFEDLARKYLGNSIFLFFGKDVIAVVTFLSFLAAKARREVPMFRPPFLVSLAVLFCWAAVQAFNPGSPSILYGLLGLKLYFFYVPLMFLGYGLFRNGEELERFLLFNLLLGTAIAGLGIAQSVLGLSFLNPADIAPELRELTNVVRNTSAGEHVAATTSVFVSAGRFGWFITVLVILAAATQAYLLLAHRRQAVWGGVALGAAVVGAMESGQRGPVVFSAISLLAMGAGFLWGVPLHWAAGRRLATAVRRSLLMGAAALMAMVLVFPAAVGAHWSFYYETMSPTSDREDVSSRAWTYPLAGIESSFQDGSWLLGNGTGTASLGTQYVAGVTSAEAVAPTGPESGFGTLLKEMGIVGLILWFVFTGSLLSEAWKVVKRTRQSVYFPLALAISWYLFLILLPFTYGAIAPYQNYVTNAYFWLLTGVLFRLPDMARAREAAPVPARPPVSKPVRVPAYVAGGR